MKNHFYIHKEKKAKLDIIGDVHGCALELEELLQKLGWQMDPQGVYFHEDNQRRLAFVGDLTNRGPNSPRVLEIVMDLIEKGRGFWFIGNHDDKLRLYLLDPPAEASFPLKETAEQMKNQSQEFKDRVLNHLQNLPLYGLFDDESLVIAHAGLKEEYYYKKDDQTRIFVMYGEAGEGLDEYGYPLRHHWEEDYQGEKTIIYGHIFTKEVKKINKTIGLDTGCVFGYKLTAYRWPEHEIVEVKSQTQWKRSK